MIHSTAIIGKNVKLSDNVEVGPYTVIRGNVEIGEGTSVDSHVVIEGKTRIGKECRIYPGAVIGTPPQDLKCSGKDTEVVIGDKTIIREYVTVNRGTVDKGTTQIGSRVYIMAYAHIAHDCTVMDEVILANCATLAGHVTVYEQAIIGGLTPVHQFVRIGNLAFVGGGTRVVKDIPPYCKAAGSPPRICGLNDVGLRRRNYSRQSRQRLKKIYRLVFRSGMNTRQAVRKIEGDSSFDFPETERFISFIKNSKRGIFKN